MAREKHPKKEVEAALADLESVGVRVEVKHHGHVWARVYCPCGASEHMTSVGSTPNVPENEARRLRGRAAWWQSLHPPAAKEGAP